MIILLPWGVPLSLDGRELGLPYSHVALVVKNHLPMQERQETWVQSPEDPLASHSSILAWRIPWTEEPGELQSIESKSRTRLRRLDTHPLPLFYDKSEKRDCQFVQIFLV